MILSRRLAATFGLVALIVATGGTGPLLLHAAEKAVPQDAAPAGEVEKGHVDRWGDPLPPGAVLRLGMVRFRPSGFGAVGLGFLPDGKTLIAVPRFVAAVEFWEARTGKLVRQIRTEPLRIWGGFAVSPDGKYFAGSGTLPRDDSDAPAWGVGVWEVISGKAVRISARTDLEPHDCSLAFSPDGKRLASVDNKGVVRVEDVASGAEVCRHRFPRANQGRLVHSPPSLAFSPDGSTLAVSGGPEPCKAYLWKWQAREEPHELKLADDMSRVLAFSPDGKQLAEGRGVDRVVRLWDAATGKLLRELEPPGTDNHWYWSLVFSPDGTILAASSDSKAGGIHLWDPATGRYRGCLDPSHYHGSLAISPDSRLLAQSGAVLRVWDLASGKELSATEEAHQEAVNQVAAAGDFVATAGGDGTVRVWDAATGKQRRKLTHSAAVRAVAISSDGTRLASSTDEDTVYLWDVSTGRKLYEWSGHGKLGAPQVVAFTPDGKHLLSFGKDLCLRKRDVVTGKPVLEHALRPTGLDALDKEVPDRKPEDFLGTGGLEAAAFTPDGKQFVLAAAGRFHVFDLTTGRDLYQFPCEGTGVNKMTVSPDSKLLLASAKTIEAKLVDGRARFSRAKEPPLCLWELASGKRLKRIVFPKNPVGSAAFSPNGTHFAVETRGPPPTPAGSIQLWDVATGRPVRSASLARGIALALAFSPDGKRLISAMDDTSVLVWELAGMR